jgi:DNA (cytosine-5)-methyltransferase 3A
MITLSVFDGMSCGQIALNKIGKKPTKYYASEIDKPAQIVSKANYPQTEYLGDVRFIDVSKLDPIDLFIGGSPCQSFSFAGKRKGMSTKDSIEILTLDHYLELKQQNFEFEGQSYLFWEYMRILTAIQKYNPNVKFLLENVMMGEKWQKILTQAIGINPICINSAKVSAQNRQRLYWTNIGAEPDGLFGDLVCKIPQPKDRGIVLRDILETEVDQKYYLSDKMLNYFNNRAANFNNGKVNIRDEEGKATTITASCKSVDISDNFIKVDTTLKPSVNQDKANCFTAGGNSGGLHSDMTLIVHNMMPRSSTTGKGGTGHLTWSDGKTYCLDTGNTNAVEIKCVAMRGRDPKNPSNREKGLNTEQRLEPRSDEKTNCLTSVQKDNLVSNNSRIRRLTPLECERLQTVPDGYTAHVSDTQRYKMLGNGWTVDVAAHIFSYLK